MKKNYLIFILLFLTMNIFSQIGLINDPDGFTNVRKGKTTKSEIIHQIKENEVFFINVEYLDLNSDWIKIWIPNNEPLWTESAIVSFATESHSSIKSEPSSLGLR